MEEKIGFAKKNEKQQRNYFSELNSIDVSEHVEKKNGLTYLSWAWAWAELKKIHPNAIYTIYENKDGLNYHHDGHTAWVKTGITIPIDGEFIEHIEHLPVMDCRNNSIPVDKLTSFDVNKAIQRSLTKAVARHGVGLYIYAGEDLPEETANDIQRQKMEVVEEGLKNIATRAELEDFFKSLEPKMKSDSKVTALFQKKAKEIE